TKLVKRKRVKVATPAPDGRSLNSRIYDIETTPSRWLAATSTGLFASTDEGKTWQGGAISGEFEMIAVHSRGELIAAAARRAVVDSNNNGGPRWHGPLPKHVTTIADVAIC